jgi:Trypsin/Ricin-type beta-trefoil lectin domain
MRTTCIWMKRRTGLLGLSLALAVGCGPAPEEEPDDTIQQPITNGTLVTTNNFPFSAVVKIQSVGLTCSGTKVGNRRFLTAAHCLPNATVGSAISITNRLSGVFTAADATTISRIDRHPAFDRRSVGVGTGGYDIAVFEIPVDSPNIAVLGNISANYVADGTSGVFVGYGCDNRPGSTNGGKKQRGAFTAIFNANLDVYTHAITTGGPAQICPGDSGGPALTQNSAGTWTIRGVNNGLGDNSQSYMHRTGNVRLWVNAPAKNVFSDGQNGRLLNGKSGNCIGIDGASVVAGAQAMQFYCDGRNQPADNQFFQLRSSGSGTFNLINGKSGMCLGVDGASTADGALIMQFPCASPSPVNNQAWQFVNSTGSYFQVRNGKSGKCMGVSGGSLDHGAILAQFSCSSLGSVNNQTWVYSR